jgi:hypothetical protein
MILHDVVACASTAEERPMSSQTLATMLRSISATWETHVSITEQGGALHLSGRVPSTDAFETVIAVVEAYSGRQVMPDLVIGHSRSVRLPSL